MNKLFLAIATVLIIGSCKKEASEFDIKVTAKTSFTNGSFFILKLSEGRSVEILRTHINADQTTSLVILNGKKGDTYKAYIQSPTSDSLPNPADVTWSYNEDSFHEKADFQEYVGREIQYFYTETYLDIQ